MAPQTTSTYSFETLAVERNSEEPKLLEVSLNRPDKLNAMNHQFWLDMRACMETASHDPDVHCVLIHGGKSRLFTAGLDLASELGGGDGGNLRPEGKMDVSRKAFRMEKGISEAQAGISAIELCSKPVICALHNGVIGGGIDLASACDIRYCAADCFFCIAEVNVGLAADVGTLQRLPKIVGNISMVRELALTGRRFTVQEADKFGMIGKIFPDKEACLAGARKTGIEIARKSPVAVIGTKASLNYSRDHTVQEGLDHIKLWNTLHLQSEDLPVAVKATLAKKPAQFSKL